MKTVQFQYLKKSGWKNKPPAQEIDSKNTLILVFCSSSFLNQPEVLAQLKNDFPLSTIAGCSTSGEIYKNQIFDSSLSCTALCFEEAHLMVATATLERTDLSKEVGQKLATDLLADDLKGIIVFSDGLVANGSALAEGFNSQIDPKKVSVAGGLAGDGSQFKSTWVYLNGTIEKNKVIAIGLYGDTLLINNASKGGWDIFGPERLITKSLDNVVYEIDGRPALDLYKTYLGDKASDLPASGLLFPIQIRSNYHDNKRLVRTILAINEKEKSLTFAGTVPQGYLAQLMRANLDRIIDGANEAAEWIRTHVAVETTTEEFETDSCCLAISCVGRRLVLGHRTEEEVEALEANLSQKTSVIGFYSYGELAPSSLGSPCDLHNQSMTLMSIYEVKSKRMRQAS